MEGRHKAFLRSTSLTTSEDCFPPYKVRYLVNLPIDVMKELEWEINDNLQIDVIKSGMNRSINITKEKELND